MTRRTQAFALRALAVGALSLAATVVGAQARPTTGTAAAKRDSGSTSVASRGQKNAVTFQRETFSYASSGRRDPFFSLMKSGDLRPVISDLRLVTVLYDPAGRNSVAIMRDLTTKDQYRVRVGQTLGRMRVAQIQQKQVVFSIDEFGYGRQEVLTLNDSTQARKQ